MARRDSPPTSILQTSLDCFVLLPADITPASSVRIPDHITLLHPGVELCEEHDVHSRTVVGDSKLGLFQGRYLKGVRLDIGIQTAVRPRTSQVDVEVFQHHQAVQHKFHVLCIDRCVCGQTDNQRLQGRRNVAGRQKRAYRSQMADLTSSLHARSVEGDCVG